MHRCFVIISLILSAIISSAVALAASGNVDGYIKDAKDGSPLPGANVVLKGTSLGAVSDVNGRYIIRNVPVGSYTIRASYVGYDSREYTIDVKEGTSVVRNFELNSVGVQGKEVVVTAQASGQDAAINQQLSSTQIKYVVSAARIQELPDENAAESVGRLPGVSLIRSGGEGSEVVIDGLAPQYNLITIDGVQIPPNSGYDRSVDLSDISSNMLGGIEVIKSITPDMDAAALGGTVNFQLRQASESVKGVKFNFLGQGGYNNLQNTYSDYKFDLSGESRFFNSRLGIFADFTAEQRNLISNNFGGSYYLNAPSLSKNNPLYTQSLTLSDNPSLRHRYGATVNADYTLPHTQVDLMNIVSSGITKAQKRSETYNLQGDTHNYNNTDVTNNLNMIVNILDVKRDFSFFTVDAKFSHSYSENYTPNSLQFNFQQTNVGYGKILTQNLSPTVAPSLANVNPSLAYLVNTVTSNSFARNRHLTGSVDVKSNFDFGRDIAGVFKFGGDYKYTILSNANRQKSTFFEWDTVNQQVLYHFGWSASPSASGHTVIPYSLFIDPNYQYGKFLGGDFQMGAPINYNLMHLVQDYLDAYPMHLDYPDYYQDQATDEFVSITNNYSGNEYESAAYAMSTFNFGQVLTFLPGVRFQQLKTTFTAPRGVMTPTIYEYHDTTTSETNGFWLPMAHLILRPTSWLQVHLAYTNTLTYPSFSVITPRINEGYTYVEWNNYALKPSLSSNYDAILSIYNNSLGLFTVDGFLKHINNLIFPVQSNIINQSDYPGLQSNDIGKAVYTYINDPFNVDLWGIELDWETHFWYLPGFLSGLVLSTNYTHTFSQAKYPYDVLTIVYQPTFHRVVNRTYYTDRLIYQPNNIANIAVGYDYLAFSARLSMQLTSNVFQGYNFWPELRTNTAQYVRWDLAVKQGLPWYGFQVFFDVNNISSARDENIIQGNSYPTSEQYYGLTADMGIRKSF